MGKGLSKKQVKNFLLPHIGIGDNPDSAARLSCALFAVYAGCGKRIVETYCSLEMLLMMDLVEKAGTRYRLTGLAKKRLDIEDKKESDPRVKDVVMTYRRLMVERFKFDPGKAWNQADHRRAGSAAKEMLRAAAQSPHVKKDDPTEVLRYVQQILRAMIYSEDSDYRYYNSRGWDMWILAKSMNRYVFKVLNLKAKRVDTISQPHSTGRQKL